MQGKRPPRPASAAIFLVLIACAAGTLLFAASSTHLVRGTEQRTLDYRMAARSRGPAPAKEIAIIALDDETFAAVDEPFLLIASSIADVAEDLVRNGAAVVGVDVLQEISLESFSPGQTRRMQGAAATGAVVLISYMDSRGRVKYPLAPICAAAGLENIALSNLTPDDDEVVRRQAIHLEDDEGSNLPTFPFAVTAKFLGGALEQGGDLRYRIGTRAIEAEKGLVAINYAGPPGTFRTFSFHAVREAARRNDDGYFKRRFAGKIVLIGRTDQAGKDCFATPFNVTTPRLMSGIEICANVINTVISGSHLTFAGAAGNTLALFLMCLVTAFSCYYLRPLHGTLICAGAAALYTWGAFALFSSRGLVVSVVPPVASVPLVYGAAFVYRYLSVDRRVRKIRDAFGTLVSHAIVEELWRENIVPRPGAGEEKKVTVLFSDINDFTPTCEGRSPAEVMGMLNDYYTEMVDIVLKNKGIVLGFVGDEIIAAFGAPHREERQAFLAVRTAVEMVTRLRELKRERSAPGFYGAKIGINTGLALVGFLGSAKRMEFTTIGESVNLAARIESLNKKLGTEILVSKATYEEIIRLEGEHVGELLGNVAFVEREPTEVKGFDRAVTVYEVKVAGGEQPA